MAKKKAAKKAAKAAKPVSVQEKCARLCDELKAAAIKKRDKYEQAYDYEEWHEHNSKAEAYRNAAKEIRRVRG